MRRKPSEELRQFYEAAKQQLTPTGMYEAADRAAASIAWMHGYIRFIHQAIEAGDTTTFVDAQKELQFARGELAALTHLLGEIHAALGQ